MTKSKSIPQCIVLGFPGTLSLWFWTKLWFWLMFHGIPDKNCIVGILLSCHIEMRFGDGNAALLSEFHLNLAKYLKSSIWLHKNVVVFVILLHLPIINKSWNSKSNSANNMRYTELDYRQLMKSSGLLETQCRVNLTLLLKLATSLHNTGTTN